MSRETQFYDRFKELMAKIMEENPVFATQLGDHRYDHLLGQFDRETMERQLAEVKEDLIDFEKMDIMGFGVDAVIDHTLAVQALKHFIRDSEQVRSEYRDPGVYPGLVLAGVYLLVIKDFAPMPERMKSVLSRMREVPRVLKEGKDNIILE